ncbi:Ldh family oxidoreductase [Tardiphaga sp. vice154]|uniref:Ldh family oxidoreductase n=1 Tax=Tardiphaga sp. vice154 TaxID=2592814 RepID=UPI00116543FC|nr:Ldh family oxidoreductase [Tardiphaga sp. vice154]QDM20773.1 Ldh family oxidoreductase [Tardiphaga sp. vice154]
MSNSQSLPASEFSAFTRQLLIAAGTPEIHAATVSAALVDADIEGLASHGTMLLPMYLDRIAAGSVVPAAEGRIISDTGAQIVIDADNGLGQVVAERAVALAVARAQAHGLAAVAVRNTFHFGAAGRFARSFALEGCVGIVMANTRPLLPAPGGAERVVGNNPLAIAVPTEGGPIVLDLALSAGAMGKIRLAENKKQSIPEGWASTSEGIPTTDPAEAIKGMLLPAAGAKGFGLAVMIDLLTGGLSSGAIGDAVQPLYGDLNKNYGCSNLFIAIKIDGFRPVAEFKQAASRFSDKIRESRKAPGTTDIRVPGDRAERAHREFSGTVRIADSTIASLRDAARRLNVALPPQFNS